MRPVTAVIAVTLNCNARCVMCDIWKNDMKGELAPEEYAALPDSLRDINISGGEPFLRKDLPAVIESIKRACPKARLVISSNGFLPSRIETHLREIVKIDPKVGLRISMDGWKEKHEEIRGIPGGFDKNLKVLEMARGLGISDLGIGLTVMGQNLDHIRPMYEMTRRMGLEFSITVATDSEIFFGSNQSRHRPQDRDKLKREMNWLVNEEYRGAQPKRWFRAWYERRFLDYLLTGDRPLACDAGSGFFYLDSLGQVYACHLLPLRMGNIRQHTWDEIWNSADAQESRAAALGCDKCWMTCTSKSQIRAKLPTIALQVVGEKIAAHLTRREPPKPTEPESSPTIAETPSSDTLPIVEMVAANCCGEQEEAAR